MISKSGAGPAPLPGKTVTAKQFVTAFEFVHQPDTQAAALKISTNFLNEHGCEVAVHSFHANLPLIQMHSDLEPSFNACFRLNDYGLQISRPVAQVLVAGQAIQANDLSPHHSQIWRTAMHQDGFEVVTRGFKRAFSKIADSMHRLKRSRSTSYVERNSPRKSKNDIRKEMIDIGRPFKDNFPLYGKIKEKPQEEPEESSTSEAKAKHTVHYGLATLTEKPATINHQHSTAGTGPSPAVNSPRKNIIKPRTNNISRSLSNKKRQPIKTKTQPLAQLREKMTTKSPEQKAADMSGFSVDVCKKILDDFKKIKSDRNSSNDNEKPAHRYKIPSIRRSRSRTTDTH